MVCWSVFILFFATLALRVSAAVQTSLTPVLPGAVATPVATPFIGSTITQCVRSCVSDAADANHCDSTTCVCIDPKFQQDVVACLQSRCSFTEQKASLQLQRAKCYREILADSAQTSPVSQAAGVNHTQIADPVTAASPMLEVGRGFVATALVNIVIFMFWAI